ncbi:MAG TPA: LysE family translocator [Terriglobales bacterium]|nr:LysE family translocator [Terriglobales bacterium]
MPDQTAFLTFLAAALLLNVTPGPDMLYVIGRSVGQGRKAGVVSAVGIFVGCLVHIVAAAVGLAALLASSAAAFDAVRYAGAAYLICLGVRLLALRNGSLETEALEPASLRSIFWQGVVTNVLNPKVALFFLAFLPQFVDARRGSVAFQILFLGMVFDVGGTLVNLAVAAAGGRLGDLLRRSPRLARWQRWFTGTVFLGLGLRLAWSRK